MAARREEEGSGRLSSRVAVITGSTAGIGRGIATRFASEGAHVVVSGRNADRGREVVAAIRSRGGKAEFFAADVADAEAIERLVRFAVERYLRLDIMVNNAHSGRSGSVLDMDVAAWDSHMAVALRSVFLGCHFAVAQMINQGDGGCIINISSALGLLAGRRSVSYGAAKAAIVQLTRQIAVDFGSHNIRANTICPAWIIVKDKDEYCKQDPEILGRNGAVYPLGRPGFPDDVAGAALFLASDDAGFITGDTLSVDGGLTAQLAEAVIDPLGEYYRDLLARENQRSAVNR